MQREVLAFQARLSGDHARLIEVERVGQRGRHLPELRLLAVRDGINHPEAPLHVAAGGEVEHRAGRDAVAGGHLARLLVYLRPGRGRKRDRRRLVQSVDADVPVIPPSQRLRAGIRGKRNNTAQRQ